MGVIADIEVVDALFFLTQSRQRKEQKKLFFGKKQQILQKETIEIKQLKKSATFSFN